ncbi:Putative odorant-binding protein A10 [Papilio machaon]|uniref:Putative odorant-binding protein A10 n=1 Tax=Papilio machaon TaxID=76193 RepID=A0A194QXI1_PAPMA|nr:Putative odorant-binding protein A10 [Papilio machaon]
MQLIVLVFLVFPLFISAEDKYYDRRYDYYDLDNLFQNPRLLRKYMNCFLDKGPCTPVGRVFKQLLPEVVMSACAKCSPSQRRLARNTFEAFDKYLADSRDELKRKLDPQNVYFEKFLKAISTA